MIITKMALPRRTFLRGMGAAFALPLLDAMVPGVIGGAKKRGQAVTRMGFVYVPNGVAMNDAHNYWTPKGTGAEFEFLADSGAACAVSRSADDCQRPRAEAGGVAGRRQR